jgi:hypothetical protein
LAVVFCGSLGLLVAPAAASFTSFSGVGGNNTSVTAGTANAALSAFEAGIGGVNNGAGGPRSGGFRTINWDGVPDTLADPSPLSPGFFNSGSPHGLALRTPGSGVEVSAGTGIGVSFGDINGTYTADFPAFSPSRVFSPIGSNVTDLTFYAAGTPTHATVSGFGAIFRNVEVPNSSSIEYFDRTGHSLGKFFAPSGSQGQAEFLGVLFSPETVARVEVTSGTTALGPTDNPPGTNVVALDDFAYAEPQALPSPILTVGSPANGATVTDPDLTVAGATSDAVGIAALTVDGKPVAVGDDGSWTTQVSLAPGANAVDVVATNVDGNSSEVIRTVTLTSAGPAGGNEANCRVPGLRGKTLAKARKALVAAHCKAGKISRKHTSGKPGRILAQKPKPGKDLPAGSAVALTVGKA